MSRFYDALAESLQEQYITEAWAESMPQWLKNAMSYSVGFQNTPYSRQTQSSKYQKFAYNHDYQRPRNDPDFNREATNLYGAFKAKGVDPAECEYIECDPPTNPRDPIFKDGSIPIWGFKLTRADADATGIQVYARGMNDYEKINWGNPLIGPVGNNYAFKSISIKRLSEYCDYFCYIPAECLSKLERKDFDKMHKEREERQELPVEIKRNKPGAKVQAWEVIGDAAKWGTYYERDKSGYVVVPSVDKYAKILQRSKAKNYAKHLEDFHDDLVTAWDEMMAALNGMGPDGDESDIRLTSDGLKIVKVWINVYKRYLRDIDSYTRRYGLDSDEFYEHIARLMKDLKENRDSFEFEMSRFRGSRAVTLDF